MIDSLCIINYSFIMKQVLETDEYAKWVDGLRDKRAQIKIDVRVRRLAMGKSGDCRFLGVDASELRIDYGPGYRVYFSYHGQTLIVLLAGGDKSTQPKDIRRAKELALQIRKEGLGQ